MGMIEKLSDKFGRLISAPWQRTITGAERVVMVIYDPEQERVLRARLDLFGAYAREAGFGWEVLDLTTIFAEWLASQEYRESYFQNPGDLHITETDFMNTVANRIGEFFQSKIANDKTIVGLVGVGSLFGFIRVSELLQRIDRNITGRLVVFFPGTKKGQNYRLFDGRDGWNYLVAPITLEDEGGTL